MTRLILGTAEFNPSGYAGASTPSLKEVRKILALAKEGGINMLDTAESYGCTEIIKKEAKGFCIYTKTRDWKVNLNWGDNELRGILYHYSHMEKPVDLPFVHRWVNLGVSIYSKYQLPDNPQRIVQIPFSIMDPVLQDVFDTFRTVFVRSVFCRGEALKRFSVKQCLDYVKQYRPDGVIVGVKTAKELNQILKAWAIDNGSLEADVRSIRHLACNEAEGD